ncbi:leucine-rich_repeat domain-containing protein [Hexamita inflata]|uniref:Leucine-rich repeat domain-containing protein n=1 Tax=Hexamita inflata TaxID=28002 RepID=A0AA86QEP7_9EUKA|nr:leucine-rich repeat domain-containing protein [Hexamita inflata]
MLEDFDGSHNQIIDISILVKCFKLVRLNLNHNCINKLPQIAENITYIDLSVNKIYDIHEFKPVQSFECIILDNNYIINYAFIAQQINFNFKWVMDQNFLDVSSLQCINAMLTDIQAESIIVEINNIVPEEQNVINRELDKYLACKYLQQLKLTQQEHLIRNNEQTMLLILENEKEEIDTHIIDLNFTQHFTNCVSVTVNNYRRYLSFQRTPNNIIELILNNCPISCIEGIQNMIQLKYLTMKNCNLNSIYQLQYLINLISLDLNNNQIAVILYILNLPCLKLLDIFENYIPDTQFALTTKFDSKYSYSSQNKLRINRQLVYNKEMAILQINQQYKQKRFKRIFKEKLKAIRTRLNFVLVQYVSLFNLKIENAVQYSYYVANQ